MDQRWILALLIAAVALLVLLMVLFWPSADPEPRPQDLGGTESPAATVAIREPNTLGQESGIGAASVRDVPAWRVPPIDAKPRNT